MKWGCLFAAVVVFLTFAITAPLTAVVVRYNNSESGTTPTPNVPNPVDKTEWETIFKNAETVVKVPWEILAAIMFQESGMGHNFGKCAYFPPAPSAGHVLVDGNGLRSPEDKTNFESIVTKLSYPTNKEVSCNPENSNGGAMGYMQVMPIEWAGGATDLNNGGLITSYPDPWKGQDAVYIGGLILKGKLRLGINDEFPETAEAIKSATGAYFGDTSADYKDEIYAKYLEIKSLGRLP